jgi:hypothetical protein
LISREGTGAVAGLWPVTQYSGVVCQYVRRAGGRLLKRRAPGGRAEIWVPIWAYLLAEEVLPPLSEEVLRLALEACVQDPGLRLTLESGALLSPGYIGIGGRVQARYAFENRDIHRILGFVW